MEGRVLTQEHLKEQSSSVGSPGAAQNIGHTHPSAFRNSFQLPGKEP